MCILDILALALLGIGFLLLVQGLSLATLRLAPVFPPARRLLAAIPHETTDELLFPELKAPLWTRLLICAPAVLWLVMAAFGIWIIAKGGFPQQNLLYQIFFR